ncbi:hypothetical protein G4B88_009050 [Cannabis sativa]|uniref:Uncharacterized protein n=1 Tax=Cannabis sativa TaxID=3483 RepID=A0A7J6HPJ8_CANSA|nr:hypothetical protein G4B88_009050 [Cannabis sativa]
MATTMDSPTAVRKGDPFLSFNFLFPYLELKLETITQFRIPGTDKFAKVIDFLRRQLHRDTMVLAGLDTHDGGRKIHDGFCGVWSFATIVL